MPFALSMTVVVLVSSALLLYQFWFGSLAGADGEQTHRR